MPHPYDVDPEGWRALHDAFTWAGVEQILREAAAWNQVEAECGDDDCGGIGELLGRAEW